MDAVTYALCNKNTDAKITEALSALTPGFTYKGSVATTSELPGSGDGGDLYFVGGDAIYIYNGTDFVPYAISTAEIDALFS